MLQIFLILSTATQCQDTLPNFTLQKLTKTKTQISWINANPNCVQLVVQRSYDSIKFFTSIFSSLSPELLQNGYVDNEVLQGIKTYYRIFYVLNDGKYFFTKSSSARETYIGPLPVETNNKYTTDVSRRVQTEIVTTNNLKDADNDVSLKKAIIPEKKFITIYTRNKDSIFSVLEYDDYKRFRDSVSIKTHDTIYALSATEVLYKPFILKPVWKASSYIFINENSVINIRLPLVKQHKYSIIFFDKDGNELFQVKHVKESDLQLEKTNFLHAGWFTFELFEDDKLKEKNKFYIESDF